MEKSRLRNFLIATLLFLGYSQDAAKSHVDNFQSMGLGSADVVSLKHNDISQDEVVALELELPDAYTISRDTLLCNAGVSHLDTIGVQDRLFEIGLRFFPQDTLSYSDIMYDYDTFIKTLDPSVLTAGTDDADVSYVEHVIWRTHFDHLWVSQYDHRSGLASSWGVHPSWLYSRLYEIGFAMQDRNSNKITTFDMELFDWIEWVCKTYGLNPKKVIIKGSNIYIPQPSLKQQSEKDPEPFILPKEQFLDTITTVIRKYRGEGGKVVSLTQTQYPWAEARAILESLGVSLWSTKDQHLTQGDENGAGGTCLEGITDVQIKGIEQIVLYLKHRLGTEYTGLVYNGGTEIGHGGHEHANAGQQKNPNRPTSYAAHGTGNSADLRVVGKEGILLKELFPFDIGFVRIGDVVYFYQYHRSGEVYHLHLTMYHISHFQSLKPSKVSYIIDKTYVLSELSDTTSYILFQDTLK